MIQLVLMFKHTTFQLPPQIWSSNLLPYRYESRSEVRTQNHCAHIWNSNPQRFSYQPRFEVQTENWSVTCINMMFKPRKVWLVAQMWNSNPQPVTGTDLSFEPRAVQLPPQMWNLKPQPFSYQPRYEVQTYNPTGMSQDLRFELWTIQLPAQMWNLNFETHNLLIISLDLSFKPRTIELLAQIWNSNPQLFNYQPRLEVQTKICWVTCTNTKHEPRMVQLPLQI